MHSECKRQWNEQRTINSTRVNLILQLILNYFSFFIGKMHTFEFLWIKCGFGENAVIQPQKGQQGTSSTSNHCSLSPGRCISPQPREPEMLSSGLAAPRGMPRVLGLSRAGTIWVPSMQDPLDLQDPSEAGLSLPCLQTGHWDIQLLP